VSIAIPDDALFQGSTDTGSGPPHLTKTAAGEFSFPVADGDGFTETILVL